MEMHHRLRRDPSWHPSGCNLCGQLGHQAANCTAGTINWKAIYGEDAFRIKEPIFPSQIYKVLEAKQVDKKDLEKRARAYAKEQAEKEGLDHEEIMRTAEASMQVDHETLVAQAQAAAAARAEAEAEAAAAAAAPEPAAAPAAADELPEGWASTVDPQGRTYYWHKRTQKTQWERPTAETPVE